MIAEAGDKQALVSPTLLSVVLESLKNHIGHEELVNNAFRVLLLVSKNNQEVLLALRELDAENLLGEACSLHLGSKEIKTMTKIFWNRFNQ